MVEDRHVIETLGKVEVIIENGEITSVGSSEMTYCPMFHARNLYAKTLTSESKTSVCAHQTE